MHTIVCAYCSCPLAEGMRVCDRCGAPRTPVRGGLGTAPSGYALFRDPWHGFAIAYPEGWSVARLDGQTVAFHTEGSALEFGRLPPHATHRPVDWVQATLERHAPDSVEMLQDDPNTARARFQCGDATGEITVRLLERGGLFVLERSTGELSHLKTVLKSLDPIQPVTRERFLCPNEGSFQILKPEGWVVQNSIQENQGGRFPICRVSSHPNSPTFVAMETEFPTSFIDRPLPVEPPKDEGFFGTLGRWARTVETALSGHTPMPFQGLGAVAEHHFVPRFVEAIPGSEFLGFQPLPPGSDGVLWADVRMALPDGVVRVVRLEGGAVPQLGEGLWYCRVWGFYQAPGDQMQATEGVLRGVMESFGVSAQWNQIQQQRRQQQMQQQQQQQAAMMRQNQAMHQARMAGIRAAGQASTAAFETRQQASDIQMQGWRDSQASSDHLQHQAVNAIHDVSDHMGPDQTVYSVSNQFEQVWTDGQGNFAGGQQFEDGPMDWIALKKLD